MPTFMPSQLHLIGLGIFRVKPWLSPGEKGRGRGLTQKGFNTKGLTTGAQARFARARL
jgi:hypothetical protein